MALNNTQLVDPVSIDDNLCNVSATALTVWKKSLMFNCDGFTVFDASGNLVFRVDNYNRYNPEHQVVLMDAAGMPLITMQRRKRLGLQNEWKGFWGEFLNSQKPLFTMRKPVSLLPTSTLAEVYLRFWNKEMKSKLHIEECYARHSFTVHDSIGDIVAEVKPKHVRSGVTLGEHVFDLIVRPGYDNAFVMALIIVLDQLMPSN
eukprot:PITA_32688